MSEISQWRSNMYWIQLNKGIHARMIVGNFPYTDLIVWIVKSKWISFNSIANIEFDLDIQNDLDLTEHYFNTKNTNITFRNSYPVKNTLQLVVKWMIIYFYKPKIECQM